MRSSCERGDICSPPDLENVKACKIERLNHAISARLMVKIGILQSTEESIDAVQVAMSSFP